MLLKPYLLALLSLLAVSHSGRAYQPGHNESRPVSARSHRRAAGRFLQQQPYFYQQRRWKILAADYRRLAYVAVEQFIPASAKPDYRHEFREA